MTAGVEHIRCEYCAGPLGTPERLCCEGEWNPYSIGLYRAWVQGQRRLAAGEKPPYPGDFSGWCCGRWLPHHDDIDRHIRELHNVRTGP